MKAGNFLSSRSAKREIKRLKAIIYKRKSGIVIHFKSSFHSSFLATRYHFQDSRESARKQLNIAQREFLSIISSALLLGAIEKELDVSEWGKACHIVKLVLLTKLWSYKRWHKTLHYANACLSVHSVEIWKQWTKMWYFISKFVSILWVGSLALA